MRKDKGHGKNTTSIKTKEHESKGVQIEVREYKYDSMVL
jgi:hypothetical protein